MFEKILDTIFSRETIVGEEPKKEDTTTSKANYKENVIYVSTADKAMAISAVYRCVYLISSGVAVMALRCKRYNSAIKCYVDYDETRMEQQGGAMINYLLSVKPNERMNAYTLKKYTVMQMLMYGNALWYPRRDHDGKITAIYLVSPNCWAYDVNNNTYRIDDTINAINVTCTAEDVMHFRNMCIDGGYWGVSTIKYARNTLSAVATAEEETTKRFATGGRFKAILTNDTSVKGFGEYEDEELKNLAKKTEDALQSGADIISLPGDGKLQPLSMSSADLEFMSSRKFGIEEIARFFNVPLMKLMHTAGANYKSVEMEQIDFFNEALQPICEEIERECHSKLTTPTTHRAMKIYFDKTAVYSMDLDARAKWNKSRIETGMATVNELRQEEDKEPVANGDEVYMTCNVAPLGSEKLHGNSVNP